MAKIIVAYDPRGALERGPLPEEIKWAEIAVADDVNEVDIASIAEKLAAMLLENIHL